MPDTLREKPAPIHGEKRPVADIGGSIGWRCECGTRVGPAGGAIISGCPERSDPSFEQGTAAGDAAHAEAVREKLLVNY